MKLGTVLAVLAVLGLAGVAMAQDATTRPARDPNMRPLMGQVKSVDDANSIVVVKVPAGRRGGEATEKTVVCDKAVTVTIDEKKDCKLADLKADLYVRITMKDNKATAIVASTKAPERPRGGGRGGAGGATN